MILVALNGQEADIDELCPIFPSEDASRKNEAAIKRMEKLDQGDYHSTYFFEQTMLAKIKNGNAAALKTFFKDNMHTTLNEGTLAASPRRHAKNLFISAVVIMYAMEFDFCLRVGERKIPQGASPIFKIYLKSNMALRQCNTGTKMHPAENYHGMKTYYRITHTSCIFPSR